MSRPQRRGQKRSSARWTPIEMENSPWKSSSEGPRATRPLCASCSVTPAAPASSEPGATNCRAACVPFGFFFFFLAKQYWQWCCSPCGRMRLLPCRLQLLCRGCFVGMSRPPALVEAWTALSCTDCGVCCSDDFSSLLLLLFFLWFGSLCSKTEDSGRRGKGKQYSPVILLQTWGACWKNKTRHLGLESHMP